jgi:general secretion pathway protein B
MSFILDALKKSENERQREIGPSFADVKSAAPAARIPKLWIGIGVLLLVNIIVLVVLLTRRDQASVVARPVETSAVIVPAATTPQAAPSTMPATVAAPLPAAAAPAAAAVDDQNSEASAPEPRLDQPPPAVFADQGPMPTMNEVVAQGRAALPELHLDMHVFGTDSSQRFVSINGQTLREGMQVQAGLRVEHITRDGVVLNYRGLRFLLPRQ